jgi:hypothetical protein
MWAVKMTSKVMRQRQAEINLCLERGHAETEPHTRRSFALATLNEAHNEVLGNDVRLKVSDITAAVLCLSGE